MLKLFTKYIMPKGVLSCNDSRFKSLLDGFAADKKINFVCQWLIKSVMPNMAPKTNLPIKFWIFEIQQNLSEIQAKKILLNFFANPSHFFQLKLVKLCIKLAKYLNYRAIWNKVLFCIIFHLTCISYVSTCPPFFITNFYLTWSIS